MNNKEKNIENKRPGSCGGLETGYPIHQKIQCDKQNRKNYLSKKNTM
jgi:hypothetical protein